MKRIFRPRSVRIRLTIWYVAALSVVLLVYSLGIYALLRSYLVSEIDRKLREDIESTEEVLYDYASNPNVLQEMSRREATRDRWLLEVWSGEKKAIYSSQSSASPLGLPNQNCQSGTLSLIGATLPDGLALRMACKQTRIYGANYIIRSARSADRVAEELREVQLMMLLGLPAALLLAALGGYALSRRMLRPISQMTAQAEAITADRLGDRLVVDNPNDELGRLAATFNKAFERLERSFDQMRRFTADASHELRTPLTAIRAIGEVSLREDHPKEVYRETVSSMLEETDRLRHLVDSLLTLSRADAGQLKLKPENVNVTELVQDVVNHLEVLAEEKDQTLSIVSDAKANVFVDRAIFRQALVNLIDNAIKYSPEGSSIQVNVSNGADQVQVEVADNGPGIGQDHCAKIFERFYRIENSRSRELGGTGLGLSIALWAVEAHGGTIHLESELGKGSSFRIVLTRDESKS